LKGKRFSLLSRKAKILRKFLKFRFRTIFLFTKIFFFPGKVGFPNSYLKMLTKFSSLSCLGCHLLDVLSSVQFSRTSQANLSGRPVHSDLSRLSCPSCPCPRYPISTVLPWLPCHGCPFLVVLFCPCFNVLTVLAFLSCPNSIITAALSRLSCPSCPPSAFLSPALLSPLSYLLIMSWPSCPFGSVQADL
jgi:hypothetical protein